MWVVTASKMAWFLLCQLLSQSVTSQNMHHFSPERKSLLVNRKQNYLWVHRRILSSFAFSQTFCLSSLQELAPEALLRVKAEKRGKQKRGVGVTMSGEVNGFFWQFWVWKIIFISLMSFNVCLGQNIKRDLSWLLSSWKINNLESKVTQGLHIMLVISRQMYNGYN